MGAGSVVAKIGRGLYDERRRIVVPRRRRVDHALRDHLDTYLEDPPDGAVVQWDAASRNWVPGSGRQPAVGSHLHTAGYSVSVDDGGIAWASGMTSEHSTGHLVDAGDRITVPEEVEGFYHVELHVQSDIANGTWPAPEVWAAILFHKNAAGATLGQYPAGTATSYTSVQNVGSDIHVHGGDYFQALIDWYSGVGGEPARSFQISCLSAFWWGP